MIKPEDRIYYTVREVFAQMRKRWGVVLLAFGMCLLGGEAVVRVQPIIKSESIVYLLDWLIYFFPACFVAFEIHRSLLFDDYHLEAENGCSFVGFMVRAVVLSVLGWSAILALQFSPLLEESSVVEFLVFGSVGVTLLLYFWLGTWLPASVLERESTVKDAFVRGGGTWLVALASLIWISIAGSLFFIPLALGEILSSTGELWPDLTKEDTVFGARSGSDLIYLFLTAFSGVFFAVGDAVIFSRAYLVGEGKIAPSPSVAYVK